jgi:hypothetical protein
MFAGIVVAKMSENHKNLQELLTFYGERENFRNTEKKELVLFSNPDYKPVGLEYSPLYQFLSDISQQPMGAVFCDHHTTYVFGSPTSVGLNYDILLNDQPFDIDVFFNP